jgi:hypothetical protein
MTERRTPWLMIAVVLLAAGAAFYFWQQSLKPARQSLDPVEAPAPPTAQAEPAIRFPIQTADTGSKPLPALDASDQSMWDALSGLATRQALNGIFNSEQIVRHIVVTIDNLPARTAAARLFPTKPASGPFRTAKAGEDLVIAPENARRYAAYVRIIETVDAKKLVAVYAHFYPLFQRAYQDLGYPKAYFNDRLVAVIDHLLDAPQPVEPVKLVQPRVLYQYEDPDLEASSAGHKIMMRMGAANAAKTRHKLQAIRKELVNQAVARQ